ncbi:MAG: efflux RND transporter periplasmic adaptor subunit [Chlorobium sp.]
MKFKAINKKTVRLLAVLLPLLLLFFYVALRSGPLASVPVTVAMVEKRAITPVLSGIGTIEARYTFRIGSVTAGRIKRLTVDVGDMVKAGQVVGEIDPVDLEEHLGAQRSAIKRAEAGVLSAEAQLRDAKAKQAFTASQEKRYGLLLQAHAVSTELVDAKHQEAEAASAAASGAQAGVNAARQGLASVNAEYQGMLKQRHNLLLVVPTDGVVTSRDAEAGNTVLAGQTVIEMIDPKTLWVAVRFDQLQSAGLKAALPAEVRLRSQSGRSFAASVLRVELLADRVTEEILAKVVFTVLPVPFPPVGELCEVSVQLQPLQAVPVVPNACVHRVDGQLGIWVVDGSALRFAPVRIGATDQAGNIQVLAGLQPGERVVVYSKSALHAGSRITIIKKNGKGSLL